MSVRSLEPNILWNNFEDLNAVPRPSKKEERVRQFMVDFGNKLGLETITDPIGNVIIKKPAAPGMEDRETVILQSHIDMVHQKNADTVFDFDTQGIQSYVDGDWVKAKGTTLGADNGIGASAAMSLLASSDIKHPALEALFTIDEETGMTGAKELDGSLLTGKILLNLDTEDDDEFSVGCAGGIDTNTSYKYSTEDVPGDYKAYSIAITGLKGGHSGMDIHLGRGNSNKLMNRVIWNISKDSSVRICVIEGGGLRNAIPRESFATIVFSSSEMNKVQSAFDQIAQKIVDDYSVTEPGLTFEMIELNDLPEKMVSLSDQEAIIRTIYTLPNDVWRMSEKIPGLPETSSSLARVVVKDGEFTTQSLQRSMSEFGKDDIATAIRMVFEQLGAEVVQGGDYPGWEPNPDSRILEVMKEFYSQMFNEEPNVAACHAGLECGILGERVPGLDMISFGPNIRHPHSPDEKVQISSVQKFWKFLVKVIENVPVKSAVYE